MSKYKILTILLIIFGFSEQIFASNLAYEFKETPLGFYQAHCQPRSILGGRRIALPDSFYLSNISPSKDQGPLGTCASFAAGGCVEFYHQKRVSEAEFTVLAETQLQEGDCHPGLFLGNALYLTQQMGFVEQPRFPYNNYLQAVALQNGIDPRYSGWIERLGAKKQDTIQICESHPSFSRIGNYNQTMEDMDVEIQLRGNRDDITRYRVGVRSNTPRFCDRT